MIMSMVMLMTMLMTMTMPFPLPMRMSLFARTHNTQALRQPLMRRIHPPHTLGFLHHLQIREVDRDGLAITAHQHTLQLLVLQRIDLLVRHIRRHEDEIARPGLRDEF